VLYVTTEDIFIAAGFDAVIMLKTIEIGVQLFGPIAIIALIICALPNGAMISGHCLASWTGRFALHCNVAYS
jgi:hypothetical protein